MLRIVSIANLNVRNNVKIVNLAFAKNVMKVGIYNLMGLVKAFVETIYLYL